MHSQLEEYLNAVAAHLQTMPPKWRNEELREVRQHLLRAVTAYREAGQSENEAVTSAVTQFGTPEAVGRSTITAWRRGRVILRRHLWGAAACTLAVLLLIPFVYTPRVVVALTLPVWLGNRVNVGAFEICLLTGWISGGLFPKRAVAGASTGAAAFMAYLAAQDPHTFLTHTVRDNVFAALDILGLLLAAWAGSRWRVRTGRRARQA